MPRKYLKRVLPSRRHVGSLPGVSWFAHWLGDENLWHINRRSVSFGVAIGLFFCYWPVPVQMLLALLAAVTIRANLPISVLGVWVTNPLTVVPMYAPAYLFGAWLLGERVHPLSELTLAALGQNLGALWLGCLVFGTVLAAAGWLSVRIVWHWHVQQSRDDRRRRRVGRGRSRPSKRPEDAG